ncbi:MAG: YceI family protein [Chitinophagaceae bacterium]
MKSRNLFLAIGITASALTFASCSDAPKGDAATVAGVQNAAAAEGTSITIDSSASTIRFVGNGVGKNHPGIFKITEGAVAVAGNAVTGGQFTIDINSMELEEKGEIFETKLRPHLLNADFFDAEKYPAAKFEITKVEPYTANGTDTSVVAGANYLVSGNLTLKDATKNITFPAKVDVTGNAVNAIANFDIDRTWWNMSYGNDKSLGDKFISPTVNVQLNLQAKQ